MAHRREALRATIHNATMSQFINLSISDLLEISDLLDLLISSDIPLLIAGAAGISSILAVIVPVGTRILTHRNIESFNNSVRLH